MGTRETHDHPLARSSAEWWYVRSVQERADSGCDHRRRYLAPVDALSRIIDGAEGLASYLILTVVLEFGLEDLTRRWAGTRTKQVIAD